MNTNTFSSIARACFITSLAGVAASASAHDGRRLEIQVNDGKLWAQGYLSGANPTDDGGGFVRPYFNAIHGHWANNPSPAVNAASASLPGFDLFAGGVLTGSDLTITLTGGRKWVAPPHMITPDTPVDLVSLDSADNIFVGIGGGFASTSAPGTLTLAENIDAGGLLDIDLTYDIGYQPSGVLFVLDFVLSSSNPLVEDSDTVHIILSPDGNNHMERLHHAALHLERTLGVVPAPATAALLTAGGLVASRRRRA